MCVEPLHRRTLQLRQTQLHLEAELRLQIRQVSIAFRKGLQKTLFQNELRRRVDGIHAVLLVDRLAPNDAPSATSFFEKIIEPAGAENVHGHIVDLATLA